MQNKIQKFLQYILPAFLISAFLLLEFLSHSAAAIFNHAMQEQELLKGSITVESLSADLKGNAVFEELLWKNEDGTTILRIPKGSLSVSILDIILHRMNSSTIKELTLEDAMISIHFSDDMKVDFIKNSPALFLSKKDEHWDEKINLSNKSEEELQKLSELRQKKNREKAEQNWQNFNQSGRHIKLKLNLKNCRMEFFHKTRHYLLSGVHCDAEIDTKDQLKISAYSGRFGGNMVGDGITIHGTIDFKPSIPTCNLAVLFQDVDPSSLGFGVDLKDTMTLQTYFTGPISAPIGTGNVHLPKLHIPGLDFADVNGKVHYEGALLSFSDVTAKVYGGTLEASGDYNIDTRYYHIHGIGENLKTQKAFRGASISAPVHLDFHIKSNGNPKSLISYGTFTSGSGTYGWIPFDRIQGRVDNRYHAIKFYDVQIDVGSYHITTDALSILDGKLHLNPIHLTDANGRIILTR